MSEEMTFEQAVKRREAVLAESERLYREDWPVRRICDSVVSEAVRALQDIDTPDTRQVADEITNAVMRAIAMVAGKGSDANCIMAERDYYRDQIVKLITLSPIPVYSSRDATNDVQDLAIKPEASGVFDGDRS